ncbi:hypothetical protein SteCoe_27080 [Stentor coeruleus]|uniref:GOLD domain-containing protein n=1 Tax=Stentor coeruleus TaxID=5963 RepID=A0A1R2BBF1_9CILI|nr:hypothetical protein SteCoe_27080 [Stentor coeruleus]
MILILLLSLANSISITIEGKETIKCFYQYVNSGNELNGAYVISGEKDQNVLTTLKDPNGKIIYTSPIRSREGKFDFKAENDSKYKLCFQSADATTKSISFEMYSQDGLQEENFATQDEVAPLRSSFRKVSRSLDTVYRNIQFYERRERTHRDLTETTCDRVLFSGIIKMVVLALISLSQIWMMRSLFNSKRAVAV